MPDDYIVEIPEGTSNIQPKTLEPTSNTSDTVQVNSQESVIANSTNDSVSQLDKTADIHNLQQGSLQEKTPITESEPSLKVYFKQDETKFSADESVFIGTKEQQPPVRINASHRFARWDGNTKGLKAGIYNIVLGLSTANLNMECIESIAFCYSHDSHFYSPLEIATRQELERLSNRGSGILRWQLHRQYERNGSSALKLLVVDMEIRVSPKMKATPGYIDLSFMELHAMQLSNHGNDPNFIVHRPFLWSIDVGQTVGDLDDDSIPIPKSPRRIISYSLSGDGSHLSTLSKMDKCLQLDLWKLSLDNNPTALVHIDVDTKQISSTQPKLSAQIQMPLLISGLKSLDPMMVSLSWDASNVAVIAEDDMHLARTTSIYVYHKDSSHPSEKKITSGQPNSFLPMPDEHLPEGLKGLCGYGKFHIATTNNQDARDELFITCDIFSVKIYGVFGSWQHLQTIALFKPDSIYSRKKLISGLNGRYFACSSSTNTILVYDLETGLVVSHMALGSSSRVRFSNDGSMMVVSHSGVITTRWTKSATAIASVDEIGSNAAFAHNDEKVIVSTFADKSYGRGEIGAIMDATSLSVEDILSIPMPYKEGRQKHMDNHGLTLYTAHGSKIDLIRVLDTVVQPYTRPRELCDETCYKELSPNMVIHSETPQGENEFTSASGLTFELRFHNARSQDWTDGPEPQSLSVLVSDKRGRSRMGLTIPAAAIAEPHWLQFKGFFQETSQRMIVYNCLFVMVWSLPTTLDSDFTLLSTWWAQPMPFEVSFEQQWYTTGTARCTHDVAFLQTLSLNEYYEEVPMDAFRLHHHNAFSSNPMAFLDGILVLVEMFRADDEIFQQAVLLYVGQHINSYPDPHNLASSVLVKICQAVSQKNHDHYAKFLKAFFESSYCRWVPRPDLNKETNPISILMKRSKTVPRAIDLVQIMISYCTRQAKKEKERDIHFTSPIMEPLHELIAQQDLHTDLAHSTLRKLAYIPVNERSHIVDHHIIAHPPEFRLRFWEHSTKPLYECGDPVLQLDLNPSTTSHDPQNDNFTRDLFVASFSMLWCAPEDKPDLRPSIAKIKSRARVPQSWIRTLFHVILLKCTLKSAVAVECHDFSLQMLDNPAIAALVEYKWNTIGYIHWLMRFLWQCIYYLLVLVAVFMQVYQEYQTSLTGVFIAIIVMATVFLWLELIQLFHSPRRYISSPYNIVDLVTYALPLAASACQIVNIVNEDPNGNKATLSFSVLFIFLHCLFELRINKSVCHFVTIIIRCIGEIRVFFVVFTTGILAFTIAILHLLHGCPAGSCAFDDVALSKNFFRAISSTYFFMGGIWDPISDDFNSDNYAFHIMMIIYFFFTTILLLNVLIALINVAFGAGDETWYLVWIENRLRYVEAAENMSHHIPGFREAHNWFPKEIYYSATLQQQKDYRAKHLNKKGQDSGRGDATHRLFGQGAPAKNVTAASSMIMREANASEDTLLEQHQQMIQELKRDLIEKQEKIEKRVEDLHMELTEIKHMVASLCKEP